MKGFKPTGYGPSAGFKFPARMGFTGSTGSITNVSPYTRRKAFADGGFVRQDSPRMKSEEVGDQGSALTRRTKPYNNLDQESGGKTPLRPGFKKGGRMKKADGGPVRRGAVLPRRQTPYTFAESVKAIPEIPKEVLRTFVDKVKQGMAGRERGMVGGKNQSIDEYVANASTGQNYARGGKARGGLAPMIGKAVRMAQAAQMQRPAASPQMMRDQMMRRGVPMVMRSKGGASRKRMGYENGGSVKKK